MKTEENESIVCDLLPRVITQEKNIILPVNEYKLPA